MPTEISVVQTLLREFCSIRFREKRRSEPERLSSVGGSVVTSPSFRKVSHSPERVPLVLQRLQGDYSDDEREAKLFPDERLFNVPSSLLRVLDRDLKAAGIAKPDDRGRRALSPEDTNRQARSFASFTFTTGDGLTVW